MTQGGQVEKIYKGHWIKDTMCGEGKTTWKVKGPCLSYGGKFRNDLPHGKGLMIYSNNQQYAGYWDAGLRHGYGDLSHTNGEMIYEGMWANDLYEGKGTLFEGS